MAKLLKKEYIENIKGICIHKNCAHNPLVTNLSSFHSSHVTYIINYEMLQDSDQSLAQRLYENHPGVLNVFSFLNKSFGDYDLADFTRDSMIKKEEQLDILFEGIIQYFTKEVLEMKSNIKALCEERQKSLILGYIDSLRNIYNTRYDSSLPEKVLRQGICHKSELESIKKYLIDFHSSKRSSLDQLLIKLFQLLDSPISFGELPEVVKSFKFPVKNLKVDQSAIDQIKSQISNLMSFNSFSSIIKEDNRYPIEMDSFSFRETPSAKVNTNDNGWLCGIAAFPPISLMHQVGDSRLPLMYQIKNDSMNNSLVLASTEGNVSVWSLSGKLRDIFREGKLINSILVFPPKKLPREQTEDMETSQFEETYSGLVAGFSSDSVTVWDITKFEKRISLRLTHEHFISSAIIYPLKIETQNPYYKHFGKITEYKYCLVTTGADLTLKIWSIPDLNHIKTIMNVNSTMIGGMSLIGFNYKKINKVEGKGPKKGKSVSTTKDGRSFYLITYDKEIKTWELEKDRTIGKYRHYKIITSLVVIDCSTEDDPYGNILKETNRRYLPCYIFSSEDSIYILSFPGHKLIKCIRGAHEGVIRKLELIYLREREDELKLYLMSVGVDRVIKIWDWKKGKCVRVIQVGVKCDGPTMIGHEVIEGNLRRKIVAVAGRNSYGKKILNIFNE